MNGEIQHIAIFQVNAKIYSKIPQVRRGTRFTYPGFWKDVGVNIKIWSHVKYWECCTQNVPNVLEQRELAHTNPSPQNGII